MRDSFRLCELSDQESRSFLSEPVPLKSEVFRITWYNEITKEMRNKPQRETKGERLSYRTVYDCFKRIVKKMGASELRFHDLRHTYAVISIKNGDDIKTVQNNLGHATASFTLDVYGHVTEQMKRDSSSRMESFIQGLSDLR